MAIKNNYGFPKPEDEKLDEDVAPDTLRGLGDFALNDPEKISLYIGSKVDKAQIPSVNVSAEESLLSSMDGFESLCKKSNLKVPNNIFLSGGENDSRDFNLEFDLYGVNKMTFDDQLQDFNFYAVSDDSGNSFNRGGIMFHFDEDTSEINMFLSQAPQFDQISSNLANASVIKAGLEIATDSTNNPEEIVNKVAKNIETIQEEFGERNKPMDLTSGKLVPSLKEDTFHLQLSNLGNNKCLIINPNTGKVNELKMSESLQQIDVSKDEIVLIASDELFKPFKSKREPAEIQIGNKIFIESQMGKPLKTISNELIKEVHDKGYDTSISMLLFKIPSKSELSFH